MIDVNELRKGVTFEMDEGLFKVLEYSHNKTGRGNASINTRSHATCPEVIYRWKVPGMHGPGLPSPWFLLFLFYS